MNSGRSGQGTRKAGIGHGHGCRGWRWLAALGVLAAALGSFALPLRASAQEAPPPVVLPAEPPGDAPDAVLPLPDDDASAPVPAQPVPGSEEPTPPSPTGPEASSPRGGPASPIPAVLVGSGILAIIQALGLAPVVPASIAGAAFLFIQFWTAAVSATGFAICMPCVWPWVYTVLAFLPAVLAGPIAAWPIQQLLRKAADRRTPLLPMMAAGSVAMMPLWFLTAALNVVATWIGCCGGLLIVSSAAENLVADGWQRQVATYYAYRRWAPPLAAAVALVPPALGMGLMLAGVPVAALAMIGVGWGLGKPGSEASQQDTTDLFWVLPGEEAPAPAFDEDEPLLEGLE